MLKGLGGLGDMAGMMKKAQELQGKMAEMQEALATMTVQGESGAGLVKATATAKGELTALDIDPSIFNEDDKEVAEDLILARDQGCPGQGPRARPGRDGEAGRGDGPAAGGADALLRARLQG